MALARITEWRKLPLDLAELCIDTTLRCGQSFRWRQLNDEWICALHGRILSLKQDSTHLHYRVTWPSGGKETSLSPGKLESGKNGATLHGSLPHDDSEEFLRHYLSLKLDLTALYEEWSRADPNFKKKAPGFGGVRMLSQDAWEALICFICSSNNNIVRISQMAHKLCVHYGPLIGHVHGEPFHDFPTPEALTGKTVESRLRELGFGYRARYIAETARIVATEMPKGWLDSLTNPENPSFRRGSPDAEKLDVNGEREVSTPPPPPPPPKTYKEAHQELLQLPGVGPKVADCVCLMGLGWGEAVPVDTHVWQIARRDYKLGSGRFGTIAANKTFNKATYDAVGDHFRGLWGPYAGWAHSVLFTADLKAFSEKSVRAKVVKKEEKVKEEEEENVGVALVLEGDEARVKIEEGVSVKVEGGSEGSGVRSGRKRKASKVSVEVSTVVEMEGGPLVKQRRTRSQRH